MSTRKGPDLIKLYIKSCVIGFVAAAVFVGLLLGFNVANLGHLILSSPMGFVAVAMMWLANGIVFAGVQFGITIMGMAEDDDDDQGGKRSPVLLAEPVPVRVPVTRGR